MTTTENTQVRVRRTYEQLVPAGGILFEEGDEDTALYVIQSGEIELARLGPGGPRVIARLGPGEFFGEMSVILGETRSARAVAVSESRVLLLDGETFEAMCIERPEIALRVIRRLTARLIESERRLAALGIDDLLRPVLRAMIRHAEPASDGVRVASSLQKLADAAGMSMLEAHRALHQLLDRKLVRISDDVLIARDLESLATCLEPSESAPAATR